MTKREAILRAAGASYLFKSAFEKKYKNNSDAGQDVDVP